MESTFTDWLESISTAVAAAAAIYAGYYAHKAYKKQNKDVQDQIDSLKKLADHQSKENELNERRLVIEENNRISLIKPHLVVSYSGYEEPFLEFQIKNLGGIAKNLILRKYFSMSESFENIRKLKNIAKDEIITMNIEIKDLNPIINFQITYEDEDKKRYLLEYEFNCNGDYLHLYKSEEKFI
ncbi:MAG: hypothetical protein ABI543_10810 [Ignavibacteria bacterium]